MPKTSPYRYRRGPGKRLPRKLDARSGKRKGLRQKRSSSGPTLGVLAYGVGIKFACTGARRTKPTASALWRFDKCMHGRALSQALLHAGARGQEVTDAQAARAITLAVRNRLRGRPIVRGLARADAFGLG